MSNPLNKLCKAIGYPELPPEGAGDFVIAVDGTEITAKSMGSRIVLQWKVTDNADDLEKLASYAAGRIFKDDAVLSWDEASEACVLWQDIQETGDASALLRFFESFMDSCDWWSARQGDSHSQVETLQEMIIMP